jgi:hypothetical protein
VESEDGAAAGDREWRVGRVTARSPADADRDHGEERLDRRGASRLLKNSLLVRDREVSTVKQSRKRLIFRERVRACTGLAI